QTPTKVEISEGIYGSEDAAGGYFEYGSVAEGASCVAKAIKIAIIALNEVRRFPVNASNGKRIQAREVTLGVDFEDGAQVVCAAATGLTVEMAVVAKDKPTRTHAIQAAGE